MALKLVSKKPKYNVLEMEKIAQEYTEISKQIKMLEETKKTLAEQIKEGSELNGAKDNKGSFYYTAGEYMLGKVASKKVTLDQEKTIDFLKQKDLYKQCVKPQVVEVIDEKELSKCVEQGIISQKEFESICNIQVTYRVSVTPIEEMPDVDTSNKLMVASKKKK